MDASNSFGGRKVIWLQFGLAALSAAAAFAVGNLALLWQSNRARGRSLSLMQKYSVSPTRVELLTKELPNQTGQVWLSRAAKALPARYSKWLSNQLQTSGQFDSGALEKLLARKLLYVSVGVVLGCLMMIRPANGPAWLFWLTAAGFALPDLHITKSAQKRTAQLQSGLADAIDLLVLAVGSGLSLDQAISRVTVAIHGPIAEDLAALLNQVRVSSSRAQALNDAIDRTKSPALKQFLNALLQADGLGISLTQVLNEQAKQLRLMQKDAARERAQKVSVKILMPLMFCFLPAVFIVLLGPALINLVQVLGGLG